MKNRKFAWELFKNTGNIDAYMLMKDVEYSEQLMTGSNNISNNAIGEINGDNKDKGNSYQNC
jgi:hypothetical protein